MNVVCSPPHIPTHSHTQDAQVQKGSPSLCFNDQVVWLQQGWRCTTGCGLWQGANETKMCKLQYALSLQGSCTNSRCYQKTIPVWLLLYSHADSWGPSNCNCHVKCYTVSKISKIYRNDILCICQLKAIVRPTFLVCNGKQTHTSAYTFPCRRISRERIHGDTWW